MWVTWTGTWNNTDVETGFIVIFAIKKIRTKGTWIHTRGYMWWEMKNTAAIHAKKDSGLALRDWGIWKKAVCPGRVHLHWLMTEKILVTVTVYSLNFAVQHYSSWHICNLITTVLLFQVESFVILRASLKISDSWNVMIELIYNTFWCCFFICKEQFNLSDFTCGDDL